ncbi:NAD(P)H-dependent flavin oxidoreductase [Nocardia colli]|uniref:NAD(P)H-dependent flavin oxidoreductase n=1 Tax=Nocardia colli TaxID=2545717 RepID=UPI0035D9FD21
MTLPSRLAGRLSLPLIAAPMTGVSGPELVVAAGRAGVIGSFPTHNAATVDELDAWLALINSALRDEPVPFAPNLLVHKTNGRLADDVAVLIEHGVELVIASVGRPDPVIEPLHAAGCLVFADVASLRHVDRALEAGVDGLVLLTAGAGGQTGNLNPFAFVRAVRDRYDGPIVLAGGVSDGAALAAAEVLGADLAYMGTGFIATAESAAAPDYRDALVAASLDDVVTATLAQGLPTNFLASWPEWQDARASVEKVTPPAGFDFATLLGQRNLWGAGHSVSGVREIRHVHDLVADIAEQYYAARARTGVEPLRRGSVT